jgi:hypothetical protein
VAAVVVAAVEPVKLDVTEALEVGAVTAQGLAALEHLVKVVLEAQDRRNLDHMAVAVVAELRRLVRMGWLVRVVVMVVLALHQASAALALLTRVAVAGVLSMATLLAVAARVAVETAL